jgi:hypothetical protein
MKDRYFILAFAIGYFLSFDVMVRKPTNGFIAFMGSNMGITIVALSHDYSKSAKKDNR